jgi:hypothetical protein
MTANMANTIVTVMGVLGLVLVIASVQQGRYVPLYIVLAAFVGFYVYAWWVRRTDNRG